MPSIEARKIWTPRNFLKHTETDIPLLHTRTHNCRQPHTHLRAHTQNTHTPSHTNVFTKFTTHTHTNQSPPLHTLSHTHTHTRKYKFILGSHEITTNTRAHAHNKNHQYTMSIICKQSYQILPNPVYDLYG